MFFETKSNTIDRQNTPNQNLKRGIKPFALIGLFLVSCNLVFGATPLSPTERTDIETIIGYKFSDPRKLDHVFHHNSLPGATDFQRLEWRGDSRIRDIVAEHIYSTDRTTVSNLQAELERRISNANFSEKFRRMGLIRFLRVNPTTDVNTVASDAFEALVTAIHYDSQTKAPHAARDFVLIQLFGIRPFPIAVVGTAAARPAVTITIRDLHGNIVDEGTRENKKTKTATKQIIKELAQRNSISGKKQLEAFRTACAAKGWSISREKVSVARD